MWQVAGGEFAFGDIGAEAVDQEEDDALHGGILMTPGSRGEVCLAPRVGRAQRQTAPNRGPSRCHPPERGYAARRFFRAAAMPARPVASSVIVAGSGTTSEGLPGVAEPRVTSSKTI